MDHERRDVTDNNEVSAHNPKDAASYHRIPIENVRASEMSEMRQWAKELRVNKPIPKDLLPLLAKDNAKQLEIVLNNMSLDVEGK